MQDKLIKLYIMICRTRECLGRESGIVGASKVRATLICRRRRGCALNSKETRARSLRVYTRSAIRRGLRRDQCRRISIQLGYPPQYQTCTTRFESEKSAISRSPFRNKGRIVLIIDFALVGAKREWVYYLNGRTPDKSDCVGLCYGSQNIRNYGLERIRMRERECRRWADSKSGR